MAVVHVNGLPAACEELLAVTGWTHDRCATECDVSLSTWQKMRGASDCEEPLKIQRHFVQKFAYAFEKRTGRKPKISLRD